MRQVWGERQRKSQHAREGEREKEASAVERAVERERRLRERGGGCTCVSSLTYERMLQ
jgi:hypothetical protein